MSDLKVLRQHSVVFVGVLMATVSDSPEKEKEDRITVDSLLHRYCGRDSMLDLLGEYVGVK